MSQKYTLALISSILLVVACSTFGGTVPIRGDEWTESTQDWLGNGILSADHPESQVGYYCIKNTRDTAYPSIYFTFPESIDFSDLDATISFMVKAVCPNDTYAAISVRLYSEGGTALDFIYAPAIDTAFNKNLPWTRYTISVADDVTSTYGNGVDLTKINKIGFIGEINIAGANEIYVDGLYTNVPEEISRGQLILLERGMQFSAMVNPYHFADNVDMDVWGDSNFTSMDFCLSPYANFITSGLPWGMPSHPSSTGEQRPWGRWVGCGYPVVVIADNGECDYSLVKLQYKDEQPIDAPASAEYAVEFAKLKEQYPCTLIYTNQSILYNKDSNGNTQVITHQLLRDFIETAQPDMLSYTEYPFRFQGGGGGMDYVGGSPTFIYKHMELYRQAAYLGLDGTASMPVPLGMYTQTHAAHFDPSHNDRNPSESEFRLQYFAGLAFGFKAFDAFQYNNSDTQYFTTMFFMGTTNQVPTDEFDDFAFMNNQLRNIAPSLLKLKNTEMRIKRGRHYKELTLWEKLMDYAPYELNVLPTPMLDFNSTCLPRITSVVATNKFGTKNDGYEGDVLIGAFSPLHYSLVPAGDENDMYFMIVNGLTAGTGTANDCRQVIRLDFDFSGTNITQLLRRRRDSGVIEVVPLTADGGGLYHLWIELDGGTGDLFKFDTGSDFIAEGE